MKILVDKINESFYQMVEITPDQRLELKEWFSAYAKNFEHSPKYKSRVWNGKIYYFDAIRNLLAVGFKNLFIDFCKKFNYQYQFLQDDTIEFDKEKLDADILEIYQDSTYTPRDYQYNAISKAFEKRRGVLQVATGGGKSLIVHTLTRLYLNESNSTKVLIVVPTIGLVKQIFEDFKDYGWDAEEHCCLLHTGKKYDSTKRVLISTYQSLTMEPEFFEQYSHVIVDEAHGARGTSIMNILRSSINAKVRIGLTGTMPKEKCELMNVISQVGPVIFLLKSSQLIEKGVLSNIAIIKGLIDHKQAVRRLYSGCDYASEQTFVETDLSRNNVIVEILRKINTTHNVLILCAKIEHLNLLMTTLTNIFGSTRKVIEVHGKIKANIRENERTSMETSEGTIMVATFGTMSTGISVKRLHHVIFASSSKSEIRVLQSVGRGLRTHATKDIVYIWDMVDDLRVKNIAKNGNIKFNATLNYGLKHWNDREVFYKEQKFKIGTIDFKIEEDK